MPPYARHLERAPRASRIVDLHSVNSEMCRADPSAKWPLIAHKRPREGVEVVLFRSIDGANSRIVPLLTDMASLHLYDRYGFSFDRDDVGFKPSGPPVGPNDFNVVVMEMSGGDSLSPSSDSPSSYSMT